MHSIDHSRRRDGSAFFPAGIIFTGILVVLLVFPALLRADEPDQAKAPVDRIPVKLWPTTQPKDDKARPKSMTLDGWTYRAVPASNPRDGVPWEVIVEPSKENNAGWRKAGEQAVLPMLQAVMCREGDAVKKQKKSPDAVPTIEMPDILWKQRMAADLQDVVGIHFHEYVSDDLAGILFTIHQVELGNTGSQKDTSKKHKNKIGTRLEATLLAPLIWSLDQSVVIRVDPLHKELTKSRSEHEMGHAQVSSRVLLEAPEGPQNWNLERCTGRRSRMEYYWKRELIGREWDGYRGGKLLTLRTSIAIVPPTRWSMLLPIPPDRVTQKHIQDFNDAIVHVGPQFILADQQAQDKFHSHHGSFERAPGP